MQDIIISPKYAHSKVGNFMFGLCAKATEFLLRHRMLYYLLACTWGLILTIFGLLISLALAIGRVFSKNIHFERYNWVYCVKVGPNY